MKGFRGWIIPTAQCRWILVGCVFFAINSNTLIGSTLHFQKIPDEYESVGGHGLGMGQAGVAANGGIAATRLNPALLPLDKQYSVGMDYH